jgi:hypothetical protein
MSDGITAVNPDQPFKVTYLNNAGAGFAKKVVVEPGTTIIQLLTDQGVQEFNQFTIRVRNAGSRDSETPTANYILKPDDFVSCVPRKCEGALID